MTKEIALLTILLPFFGFVFNMIWGKKLKDLSGFLATGTVLVSFLFTCFLAYKLDVEKPMVFPYFTWVAMDSFTINFSIWIDSLTIQMMSIITGIGMIIHFYSIGYMSHDENKGKFFAYLNLFIFSMLILVMGSNLVTLFIGWEGVGLCSFLLIGFWYKNTEYVKAAQKAFIMNRIGDLGLLIGIFLCIYNLNTVEFVEINEYLTTGFFQPSLLFAITLCLFIGATGKSAQIPLFTWLPDAMAGPTPVSALIHAATMVTAGIYLVVRNAALFEAAPYTKEIILVIALSTALIAAIIALYQNDIKKVLAYSTVSQLGFMFMALGVGAYSTAMFHLTTHAFFKALLFLGAGSVIHAVGGNQDIMTMGGLRNKIKQTHFYFLIGTLAIIGFPLLSGFFSKDEILEKLYEHSFISWLVAYATAGLTIVYMLRLYFLTFWGDYRGSKDSEKKIHESPFTMTFPLGSLATLSVLGGLLNLPSYFGANISQWMAKFLHPIFSLRNLHNEHHLSGSTEAMLIALAIGLVLVLGLMVYSFYKKRNFKPNTEPRKGLALIGENKFYLDKIYNTLIVKPTKFMSDFLYHNVERHLFMPLTVGSSKILYGLGIMMKALQNGNVEYYLTYIALGVMALMAYIFITQ